MEQNALLSRKRPKRFIRGANMIIVAVYKTAAVPPYPFPVHRVS